MAQQQATAAVRPRKGREASDFSENGWESQRIRRRAPARKGKANSGKLRGAPAPKRHIFVYRVVKQYNCDDVVEHLKDTAPEIADNVNVELVAHPESKYNSFKVTCSASDFVQLMDENVWPEGSNFRQYKVYRNRENQREREGASSLPTQNQQEPPTDPPRDAPRETTGEDDAEQQQREL
jgi:hypothetical protein